MNFTPSTRRRRFLCAVVGHFLRVNDSRGWAVNVPWRRRWRFAGSEGNLAGCRCCGAIWNDLAQEYKVPMRAIGRCRKCRQEVFASTKDGRVFAACYCSTSAGIHTYQTLKPVVNGKPT